jgi:Aromatic-ring-opening dioxygenase LigAB, LigA subunit
MKSSALTQFLIDVTRGSQVQTYASDPEAVLRASDLSSDLRAAIEQQDIGSLWRAGAHPMALLYFARACGWSGERYYECITKADASVEQTSNP